MRRPLLTVPVLLLSVAACAAVPLPADEVATEAEDALEQQEGLRPDITCPEDLAAEVGAETRCTLTTGDDPAEYGVTVTVTAVEGNTANFDVRVDEQPQG